MKRLPCAMLVCATVAAQSDPGTWTTYGKNLAGWRYSELDQINANNVSRLTTQWMFQTSVPGN